MHVAPMQTIWQHGRGGFVPRPPRVLVEGGTYHVYNRFARGADLFADPDETIEFLEIPRKERDRDGLTVFAGAS